MTPRMASTGSTLLFFFFALGILSSNSTCLHAAQAPIPVKWIIPASLQYNGNIQLWQGFERKRRYGFYVPYLADAI